ncbi:MAG TPA: hypothetical protein VKQ36_05660, partial [Ktedonobacterales bacterium]|nr:hypothetical protein [Ktedonobacterales bacterium]
SFVSIVFTVLIFILAIVAGARAAGKNGKVGSGAVAGLWVGLLGAVLGTVGALIFDYLNLDALVRVSNQAAQTLGSNSHIDGNQYLLSAVIGSVLVIIIDLLIGLGLGAIGGLIGRGRAPKPPVPAYQESMYAGLTPTAPIYPPQQPVYPPQGYPPQQPPQQ